MERERTKRGVGSCVASQGQRGKRSKLLYVLRIDNLPFATTKLGAAAKIKCV
jgi:hypothetical protein